MAFSQDRPGQLFGVLKEFAERNINLTKIESRPTRLGLGKYYFLLDIEGHRDDPVLAEVLGNIRKKASLLKVFGSYPRMTVAPYIAALVRETAALRGYRSQEQVLHEGVQVDVLLQSGRSGDGRRSPRYVVYRDVRATAESFREAGLAQAIFVFADPTVAEKARTAAAEWPEELAATAIFTTADHIGELL